MRVWILSSWCINNVYKSEEKLNEKIIDLKVGYVVYEHCIVWIHLSNYLKKYLQWW